MSAEGIRRWRNKDGNRERERQKQYARRAAAQRLAVRHPTEYGQLLTDEFRRRGLAFVEAPR